MEKHKDLLFTLFVIAGFAVIIFVIPRIAALIMSLFGLKLGRGLRLIIMAVFFYFWGEICLHIKNENDIE